MDSAAAADVDRPRARTGSRRDRTERTKIVGQSRQRARWKVWAREDFAVAAEMDRPRVRAADADPRGLGRGCGPQTRVRARRSNHRTAGTATAVKSMGFEKMTKIQERAIPPLLEGRDLLGNAKTGSGKTLAFLVPMVDLLTKARFAQRSGLGGLAISPTRELSLQIYGARPRGSSETPRSGGASRPRRGVPRGYSDGGSSETPRG